MANDGAFANHFGLAIFGNGRLHDERLKQIAAVGDGGVDVGHLQRGCFQEALANREVDCIADGPVVADIADLPLRAGNRAGNLLQIGNTGGSAEAIGLGHIRQQVLVLVIELIAELIEDGVARVDERGVQGEHPLLASFVFIGPVAADHVGARNRPFGRAVDLAVAGVAEVGHRCGHRDHLEDRPGGVSLLGGAIEQRQFGFVENGGGVFVGQASDEDIRVETGMTDQRHDRAGLRIEHDCAAGHSADRGIDLFLELDVDGEHHVFRFDRVLLGDDRLLGARIAGHDGKPAARLAREQIVCGGLHARPPDHRTGD